MKIKNDYAEIIKSLNQEIQHAHSLENFPCQEKL